MSTPLQHRFSRLGGDLSDIKLILLLTSVLCNLNSFTEIKVCNFVSTKMFGDFNWLMPLIPYWTCSGLSHWLLRQGKLHQVIWVITQETSYFLQCWKLGKAVQINNNTKIHWFWKSLRSVFSLGGTDASTSAVCVWLWMCLLSSERNILHKTPFAFSKNGACFSRSRSPLWNPESVSTAAHPWEVLTGFEKPCSTCGCLTPPFQFRW